MEQHTPGNAGKLVRGCGRHDVVMHALGDAAGKVDVVVWVPYRHVPLLMVCGRLLHRHVSVMDLGAVVHGIHSDP